MGKKSMMQGSRWMHWSSMSMVTEGTIGMRIEIRNQLEQPYNSPAVMTD